MDLSNDPFLQRRNAKQVDRLYDDPFFKRVDYRSNMLGNLGLMPRAPVQYDKVLAKSAETRDEMAEINRKLDLLMKAQTAKPVRQKSRPPPRLFQPKPHLLTTEVDDRAAPPDFFRSSLSVRNDRKVNFSGDLQSGRLPAKASASANGQASEPAKEGHGEDGGDSGAGVAPDSADVR